MGSLSLVFIVALVSGFSQDTDGMKPRMSPNEHPLLLYTTEALMIECYSDGAKLKFSFPESTLYERRSEHEINVSDNGTVYTFLRRFPIGNDAGWYACAEEGVAIDNDFRNINHTDQDVSWIYIYINDMYHVPYMDIGLKLYPKTIISVAGSVVVIPCHPKSPDTEIQLWQNFKLVDLKKEAVWFDSKIGFVMEQVVFLDNEAIFQCKTEDADEGYIIRYSESKPTMINPDHDSDVTLQEGDVLRIECFSESKLSFLYPTTLTSSSEYQIVENKNGTSTFLRRSIISDDTGWYGCAGMDIGNNEIPAYSINYTKKEISWVYVYVNSSVKIISPIMDTVLYTPDNRQTNGVIPCRATSPELHIQIEEWSGKIWITQFFEFDPKLGYFVQPNSYYGPNVYRCTMTEPVRYVSKNYSMADVHTAIGSTLKPTILNVDDSVISDDLIIRMTGDDLRLRCETVASTSSLYLMEWTVPSTVSANRIKYNRTRSNYRIDLDILYLRKKTLTITVTNLSETDTGNYICAVTSDQFSRMDSRTIEVFDEAGARYVRPENGEMADRRTPRIIGRKGDAFKWLLDLRYYPSAKITRISETAIESPFEMKTASTGGAPLILFMIKNLTTTLRGIHWIYFESSNETNHIVIDVIVQELPTVRLNSMKELLQKGDMRMDARCQSFGSPTPNLTIAFRECPKYPSLKNCNLSYYPAFDLYKKDARWMFYRSQFNISMSGILACEACNTLGCSVATKDILFSASDEPYFTSTNLNKTKVVLDMATKGSSKTLIFECYAAGNPYPTVTWFEDGVELNDSRQHKLAYDNRELSVTYYIGDGGGRYTCRAANVHGHVENHIDIHLRGLSDQKIVFSTSVIAVFVILLALIIICCIIIYRLCAEASRKKSSDLVFKKGALDRFDPELSVVDQANLLPYDLKWEYPRGLLKLGKTLGSGAFGIVRKAEAKSISRGEAVTTVAVKMVRSTASLNFMTALTRELKILAYLGKHPNVVNLLGACTKNVFYGELYVIVEFCRFGNLRDHLLNGRDDFIDQLRAVSEDVDSSRVGLDFVNTNGSGLNINVDVGEGSSATKHRCQGRNITGTSEESDDDVDWDQDSGEAQRWRSKYEGDYTNLDVEPICTRDLVYWSWQVSRGMEFLGQRRIVHGDLAARNILLADNGIVKVCDFGLAKALYNEAEYRDQGGNPLPVKWMAIESIKDLVFSVPSDVWSFGIVMWEIFSLGETPYPGMRQRGLVQKLIEGYRMGHPKYAAMAIYDMMRQCWDADPAKRPSFTDLSHKFGDSLDDGFKAQYLEMHAQYMEINAEALNDGKKDYLTMSPATIAAASSFKVGKHIELHNLPQDISETSVRVLRKSS